VATEAVKGSRGSDPRLLGLTMGRLLDRTFGVRPRASRIVHALGLDQPSIENANLRQLLAQAGIDALLLDAFSNFNLDFRLASGKAPITTSVQRASINDPRRCVQCGRPS
jgi:hypothetical protein